MHLRRGGLRAHADEPHLQIVQNAHLLCRFREVHGIAGRGDECRRTEVLQEHNLPLGIARRDGNDRRAQLLHAVMQAETAREQAVTERDVEDVLVRRPRHHEDARDTGRPVVQIIAGIAADDGLARRARRGVQADDLLHRHGEEAERIMIAQIVFGRVRNIFNILERFDMLGFEADFIEPLLIHRHALVGVRDDMFQTLQLHLAQLLTVDFLNFGTEHCHFSLSPVSNLKYILSYFRPPCKAFPLIFAPKQKKPAAEYAESRAFAFIFLHCSKGCALGRDTRCPPCGLSRPPNRRG